MHRVALPPLQERHAGKERITRERYSIPYFVAPDHDGLVECLPSMVDEKHPVQYEPVVWSEYGEWRAKHSYKHDVEGICLTQIGLDGSGPKTLV